MKVGFDGVLLGSWTSVLGASTILDIGTGTGLIALMLAQRTANDASLVAIDIDDGAIADAQENFASSPWSDRLSARRVSLQDFTAQSSNQFDLIVCNPPFFEVKSHESQQFSARMNARSSVRLNLEELFSCATQSLSRQGTIALILPIAKETHCRVIALQHGLKAFRAIEVQPTPEKPPHRVLLQFSLESVDSAERGHLTIETSRHEYSNDFADLTRDFYLSL